MPTSGTDLAADLGKLWEAGRYLVPEVGADLRAARSAAPTGVSSVCARGGGLGIGDHGPGPQLDALLDQLSRALGGTADTLDAVGRSLVQLADAYQDTDAACAAEYRRRQQAITARHPGA